VTLLVLGAGGQVGRALVERAGPHVTGLARQECNIDDAEAVGRAISRANASIVVNCAGYTAVDRAEAEREQAFAVNRDGALNVARAAAALALPVIHLSTDYVYSGSHVGAQTEDCPIAPVNVYGESKAAGDAAVASENSSHLVLRVSWVFGVHGANFVKTMLRLGRDRPELRIVDNQFGGPTEARDIADAILTMAAACRAPNFRDWGTYHYSGTPDTSWCGFARTIFEYARVWTPKLVPIPSSEYPTPAKRPSNSVLDCSKIKRVFAIAQPDWQVALARVLETLGELKA
jgi:dTDP-4-dehydrorhamnose reductase